MISVSTLFLILLIVALALKIFSVFKDQKTYILDMVINFLNIVLLIFAAKNVLDNLLAAQIIAIVSIVLFIFGNMIGILKAILNIIDPSLESKNQ